MVALNVLNHYLAKQSQHLSNRSTAILFCVLACVSHYILFIFYTQKSMWLKNLVGNAIFNLQGQTVGLYRDVVSFLKTHGDCISLEFTIIQEQSMMLIFGEIL